jgi:hypothetical protein
MKNEIKSQKQQIAEFKTSRCVVIKLYLRLNNETMESAKEKAVTLVNQTVFKHKNLAKLLGTEAYQVHFCGEDSVKLDHKKGMAFDCACPFDKRP